MQIVDMALGFFYFCFDSDEKLIDILFNGQWFIKGQAFTLLPWKDNFQLLKEKVEVTLTWIQFLGLPLELLHLEIVNKITSRIGWLVKIDNTTLTKSRGKVVKVYFLINFSKLLS